MHINRIKKKKKLNLPYLTCSARPRVMLNQLKRMSNRLIQFYLKFYGLFTLTLQRLQHFKQAQRILSNGLHTIEATFQQHRFSFFLVLRGPAPKGNKH